MSPEKLPRREQEVLALVMEGVKTNEIAKRLGVKMCTVHTYIERIKVKTGSRCLTELVKKTAQTGGGYKPMDSAPLDGTPILLKATIGYSLEPQTRTCVGAFFNGGWWLDGMPAPLSHLQRWRFLP